MKSILKLSLVSLCASGAIYAAQANNSQSASDRDADKQLIVTEPAGADNTISGGESTSQTTTTYQSGGTAYSSGATIQATAYPSSGYYQSYSAGSAPGLVTGREQDAYANCILHQYQAGKGSARATDEHYWNNVSPDRLYTQYPGSGATYQNFAYNTYSSPSASSGWTSSQSSMRWSGQQGLWYGPDGKVYNSATSMTPIQGGQFRESAGAQQSSSGQYGTSSSQPSATQYGTSGAQSSTELKGSQEQSSQAQSDLNKSSQNQPGSATSEAAGANPSAQSEQNNPSSTPSSSSTPEQSGTQASPQSSSSSSAAPSSPDQTSTSSSSSTPEQSTQSSTSSSTANEGMADKVRSTLKSDSTLSPISSNVMVQEENGKVALNGTVKSEAEKQQIVSKAEEMAGSGNVIDNLQVKAESSNP